MTLKSEKGFALVMCLLLLPSGIFLFLVCKQILFFNHVKNEILEDCFLISLNQMQNVQKSNIESFSTEKAETELQLLLLKKFKNLTADSTDELFKLKLNFKPARSANLSSPHTNIRSLVELHLGIINFSPKFKNFEQAYNCGAYLKWKDTRKLYGIIAVRF